MYHDLILTEEQFKQFSKDMKKMMENNPTECPKISIMDSNSDVLTKHSYEFQFELDPYLITRVFPI